MRARKSGDPGSGRSSGRLGLAVLAATVAAFLLVPVAQAAALPIITFHGTGTGNGTIVNAELGILEGNPPTNCGYESPGPEEGLSEGGVGCEPEASEFEVYKGVAVQVTAAPGSEFVGWIEANGIAIAEDECGENCDLVLLAAGEPHEVTACFVLEGEGEAGCAGGPPKVPLTIVIEEGEGTVVTNPDSYECSGAAITECTENITEGTVTLTASPAPGYIFKSWKKCDKKELIEEVQYGVNGRQCTINNDGTKVVGAKFIPVWALTISKASGSGPGSAKTKPGGISCGYTCTTSTAVYKDIAAPGGKEVEVATKPFKHYHLVEFLNGTGQTEACNGETTCVYSPSGEDSSIEALFEEDTKYVLSLSAEGGGQGFIKTKPSGVLCGYTCSNSEAEYYEGETVVLTIKLNKGTSSLEWVSGADTCTGTIEEAEATCEVTMNEAHSLVAKYE